MASLKIKYHNQDITIYCLTSDFLEFLNELKNKLRNSFFHQEEGFKAYFSFYSPLTCDEILKLYELCEEYNTYIIGIDYKKETSMILKQHCFYNGESYELHDNVVYIGDIEKDVYIKTGYNLYVVGQIKGKIDILFPNLEVSASALDGACIRIYDSKFHHLTKYVPCKVYYEKEVLIID